jgi:hypothetical protein
MSPGMKRPSLKVETITWSARSDGKDHLHDDQDAFVQYMTDQDIPVFGVNNEADGEERLRKQVEEPVKNLFQTKC